MPFSAIATVPMGAQIVDAAGHPAAGLVIDAWHVFRARTSFDELRAALTPEMIFGVELNDAAPAVVGTLFEDTVNNRRLCSEGSLSTFAAWWRCCATRVSTVREVWRSCRRRSGGCR